MSKIESVTIVWLDDEGFEHEETFSVGDVKDIESSYLTWRHYLMRMKINEAIVKKVLLAKEKLYKDMGIQGFVEGDFSFDEMVEMVHSRIYEKRPCARCGGQNTEPIWDEEEDRWDTECKDCEHVTHEDEGN